MCHNFSITIYNIVTLQWHFRQQSGYAGSHSTPCHQSGTIVFAPMGYLGNASFHLSNTLRDPITVYKIVFRCVLFWCWVALCVPFSKFLIACYLIMVVLVLQRRASLEVSALKSSLWILDRTCYRWMVSCVLCLDSPLGYSIGEFLALQLIIFAALGAMD